VAPAAVRSIATIRTCLVSGLAAGPGDAGTDRLQTQAWQSFGRSSGSLLSAWFWATSEVHAAPSAAPPQPRPAQIARQGQTPKRASAASSHRSNAPIRDESQSILSKKIALRDPIGGSNPVSPANESATGSTPISSDLHRDLSHIAEIRHQFVA
jgi:hypothetical protein